MADNTSNPKFDTNANVQFVYDNEINPATSDWEKYRDYNPGTIIFKNVVKTAEENSENNNNIYKSIYLVDRDADALDGEAHKNDHKLLVELSTNRLDGYTCSTKTGQDLNINNGDSVQEAIGKLHKAVIDLEYVVAAALNDINSRLNKLNV